MNWKFNNLLINIEGESHSEAIDVYLYGFPEGTSWDAQKLQAFADRRQGDGSYIAELCRTGRREPDLIEWPEGTGVQTVKTGNCAPSGGSTGVIHARVCNTDARGSDYAAIRTILRPGHADLGAYLKYGVEGLKPGGGEFSGRMTVAACIAGGIALQLLEQKGITIIARIAQIAGIDCPECGVEQCAKTENGSGTGMQGQGEAANTETEFAEEFAEEVTSAAIYAKLSDLKSAGDSCGGIVSCTISGCPGGIGGPGTDGLEGDFARAMLAIPSCKGVEFGSGFAGAALSGSENNDAYYTNGTDIYSERNNQGGISGGISTGMDITFNVAFKPVPSIGAEQHTVDIANHKNTTVRISGRHDVCIVPRVLPVVEGMAALAILDRMISEGV